MDKKIAKRIAIALCGVALTGVGATSIIKENTYTASANHQGTRVWVQYGTLKYALKVPLDGYTQLEPKLQDAHIMTLYQQALYQMSHFI